MSKKLIGTDFIYDCKTPNPMDKFYNWEWWTPTLRVKREIFDDGTVRNWYEYRNRSGECKYVNGYFEYKVDLETKLV